jgi:hypothetical protein
MSAPETEYSSALLARLRAREKDEKASSVRGLTEQTVVDNAGPERDLLEQAALVGYYDLNWLDERAERRQEGKSAVLNASEALDDSLNLWRLKAGVREEQLRALVSDPGRLTERLKQAVPLQNDEAGRALQSLVKGGAAPAEASDEQKLEAMLQAATWLKKVPEIASPNPRPIRRELHRRRLQRDLSGTSEKFVGRSEQLGQLEAFADGPPTAEGCIPVLPVFGIGGIGKSALLARLLCDRVNTTSVDARSALVFHLDFDRFGTTSATALEWSFELSRQLAFLVPDLAEQLDGQRKQAQRNYASHYGSGTGLPSGAADVRSARQQIETREAASFSSDEITYGLFRTMEKLAHSRPLLLIFDTVEALQVHSADGLLNLARWVLDLHYKGGFRDIRVVLSGRVEAMLPIPAEMAPSELPFIRAAPIELDELGREHAIELLVKLDIAAGDAGRLADMFGGNPLVLRLIAQLAAREGIDLGDLTATAEAREKADKELVQGVLYRRILGHVTDTTIQALAHPGLAVRRVTPDVLRYVIAPVCLPAPIGPEEAERLYQALAKQIWLVEEAPDGDGVVHRSDLRKLMMKLIAADERESARTEKIHRAAIGYYETGPGRAKPYARGEALYHRAMIPGGDMLPHLDRETAQLARRAIGASLDELPRKMRAALHAALDEGVDIEEALGLPGYLWEQYVSRRAGELVQRDAFEEALGLLDRRPISGDAVPEWRITALDALGRWDELFELLSRSEGNWSPDMVGQANAAAWLAVGRKSGKPVDLDSLRPFSQRLLAARPGGGAGPAHLLFRHYLIRVGGERYADPLISFTTADLLRNPETAHEFVRYLQATGENGRFRPVRTQFYPSLVWLEELQRVAGPVAAPELARFIELFSGIERERMVIGHCLGHLSLDFEAAWTDAFVRDAIPEDAARLLLEIREFSEFRTPARVAVMKATGGDRGALHDLAQAFAPALPMIPFDLAEPGIQRALSNQRDFVTNLIAYADRCQLLYKFLLLAEARYPHPQVETVRAAMERWFTPAERASYAGGQTPPGRQAS